MTKQIELVDFYRYLSLIAFNIYNEMKIKCLSYLYRRIGTFRKRLLLRNYTQGNSRFVILECVDALYERSDTSMLLFLSLL